MTPSSTRPRPRPRRFVAALQNSLNRLWQTTETVARTARIDISGGQVDEIDPPSDLDEYWDTYQSTGIVRANIDQFTGDVVEPGARVEAEDEDTEKWFNDEFLPKCFIHAGERHQPFTAGLKNAVKNRWIRGTYMAELLKQDRENPESPITGFYPIRPETVYPQVEANKNILIRPGDTDLEGIELTPRGEAAAYIQFDDRSILGRRLTGFDQGSIPLSQNDVLKQVLDPDIGGAQTDEQGIFGSSILESIATDIEEYNQTKRDRFAAIRNKAYGIWLANFSKEVLELGENEVEVVEWSDSDQDSFMDQVGDLSAGDVVSADGPIDFKKFESTVPDLKPTLNHYVDDITAPLPAPKYSVGFEKDINQFVTERQEKRYEKLVKEERRYQERKWTWAFRKVAENHSGLDPTGVQVRIEPRKDDSPIMSLSIEEIEKIKTYSEALDLLAGPKQGPGTFIEDDVLRDLVAQLPEDAAAVAETLLNEEDEEVRRQFLKLTGKDGD